MGDFQDRLRQAMTEKGFSQASLARAIGCTQPAVFQILNSDADGWKFTVRAARAMRVSPDWLEAGTGNPHAQDEISRDLVAGSVEAAVLALIAERSIDLEPAEAKLISRFSTMVCDATQGVEPKTAESIKTAAEKNARTLLSTLRVK